MSIKYQDKIRTLSFHIPFLRKLLEDVAQKHGEINKGRERHGILEAGEQSSQGEYIRGTIRKHICRKINLGDNQSRLQRIVLPGRGSEKKRQLLVVGNILERIENPEDFKNAHYSRTKIMYLETPAKTRSCTRKSLF